MVLREQAEKRIAREISIFPDDKVRQQFVFMSMYIV